MIELRTPGTEALLAALPHLDPGTRRRLALAAATSVAEWELLAGHRLVDGRHVSGESVRVQYLHLTDRLVATATSGGFDRLVFLDKSARPVAWLLRDTWALLAPSYDAPAAAAPMVPVCSFLNIDRLQWRAQMDPECVGQFDAAHVPDEPIVGLNRCFRPDRRQPRTWLDGERVLVVDEVRVSGDTGTIAELLLSRAFPHATFTAYQWMTPKLVTRSQGRYNNQLPVWYREDTVFGRGIGDRDPAASLADPTVRTRDAERPVRQRQTTRGRASVGRDDDA